MGMSEIDKLAEEYAEEYGEIKCNSLSCGGSKLAVELMVKRAFKAGALAERKRIAERWPKHSDIEVYLNAGVDASSYVTSTVTKIWLSCSTWLRSKLLGDDKE